MGIFKDFWHDITGVTASREATAAMQEGSQQGLDFMREMYEQQRADMQPFAEAGARSLEMQEALAGTLGPEAQAAAIAGIESSPGFQAALQQGETSILQNAAATGGLRGGNTQAALAQFSPQLLSSAIDQRYAQLGGLTGMGAGAAGGMGSAAMNMGQMGGNLLNQMGQTAGANILGEYNLQRGFLGDLAGFGLGIAGLATGGGASKVASNVASAPGTFYGPVALL